jgi:hypothetical protein
MVVVEKISHEIESLIAVVRADHESSSVLDQVAIVSLHDLVGDAFDLLRGHCVCRT